MPVRYWDKLKRQDKARKDPGPHLVKGPWTPHQPTAYELASGLAPKIHQQPRKRSQPRAPEPYHHPELCPACNIGPIDPSTLAPCPHCHKTFSLAEAIILGLVK